MEEVSVGLSRMKEWRVVGVLKGIYKKCIKSYPMVLPENWWIEEANENLKTRDMNID